MFSAHNQYMYFVTLSICTFQVSFFHVSSRPYEHLYWKDQWCVFWISNNDLGSYDLESLWQAVFFCITWHDLFPRAPGTFHPSSHEIKITVFRVSQEVSVQIFWMSWCLSIMGDIIPQNARSLDSLPMKSGNLTLRRLKRAHHDIIVLGLWKCSV